MSFSIVFHKLERLKSVSWFLKDAKHFSLCTRKKWSLSLGLSLESQSCRAWFCERKRKFVIFFGVGFSRPRSGEKFWPFELGLEELLKK